MAEQRKKSDSILLRTGGKMYSLELFPCEEWPEECSDSGMFRVRVNDVWHSPTGKYSFLTQRAVGELVAALLNGGEPARDEPAPYLPHKAEVRVHLDDAPYVGRAWVHAPPHREEDGRYYVWVWLPGGPRKVPANDVELRYVR